MNRTGNQKLSALDLLIPVAAGTVIREARMVAVGTDGYAVPASKTEGLTVAGCAQQFADNSKGADGDVSVLVRRGAFVWNSDGTIKGTDLSPTRRPSRSRRPGQAAPGRSLRWIRTGLQWKCFKRRI